MRVERAVQRGRPYLIVGSTDLVSGAEFDFASDQLGRLCTSIDAVPLAFAVAASSAVPLVFTPLTLANHGPTCWRDALQAPADDVPDAPRPRLVHADHDRYAAPGVQYFHLVDGGVSDNLGVRRIVDYVAQVGGIEHVLRLLAAADGRVAQHLVFVNVGSERRGPSALDGQRETAGTLQMLAAIADGGVGRASRATELAFDEALDAWQTRLLSLAPPYSTVRIYSLDVGLASVQDPQLVARAQVIPTAFRITPAHREILAEVARVGVGGAAELARLRTALGGEQEVDVPGP